MLRTHLRLYGCSLRHAALLSVSFVHTFWSPHTALGEGTALAPGARFAGWHRLPGPGPPARFWEISRGDPYQGRASGAPINRSMSALAAWIEEGSGLHSVDWPGVRGRRPARARARSTIAAAITAGAWLSVPVAALICHHWARQRRTKLSPVMPTVSSQTCVSTGSSGVRGGGGLSSSLATMVGREDVATRAPSGQRWGRTSPTSGVALRGAGRSSRRRSGPGLHASMMPGL